MLGVVVRRSSLPLALLVALVAAAPAGAQIPIPQGDAGDAPRFVGSKAEQRPAPGAPLAPQHPFLAPNGRSNIHDDAYMSDAYEIPGPLGDRTTVSSVFEGRECASVTFDSRGRIVTICVGLDRPVLTLKHPQTLQTLASYALPPRRPESRAPPRPRRLPPSECMEQIESDASERALPEPRFSIYPNARAAQTADAVGALHAQATGAHRRTPV